MSYLYLSDDDTITAVNRGTGSVVFRNRQNPVTVVHGESFSNTDAMGGGAVDEFGSVWLLDVAYYTGEDIHPARLVRCDANLNVQNRYDLFATPVLTADFGLHTSDIDAGFGLSSVWWSNGLGYIGKGNFLALFGAAFNTGTGLFVLSKNGGIFNYLGQTRNQQSGINTDVRGHGWFTLATSTFSHYDAARTANELGPITGVGFAADLATTVEAHTLSDLGQTIDLAGGGPPTPNCIAVIGGPVLSEPNDAVYISYTGDAVRLRGGEFGPPFLAERFYSGLFPDSSWTAMSACIDTDPDYFWVAGGNSSEQIILTKVNILTGAMPLHSVMIDDGSHPLSSGVVYSMWTERAGGVAPPQRQVPRDDGLGISTKRSFPPNLSHQFGLRRGGVNAYD